MLAAFALAISLVIGIDRLLLMYTATMRGSARTISGQKEARAFGSYLMAVAATATATTAAVGCASF